MRRSQKAAGARRVPEEGRWSLWTPHALVLLCIARNPETRVREIAAAVGISERGAHQIVADLVLARYVQRTRVGRRNRYVIEDKTRLLHGPVKHRRIGSIIALLGPEPGDRTAKAQGTRAQTPRPTRTRGRVAATELPKPTRRRAA